jgi:hypothetical protein
MSMTTIPDYYFFRRGLFVSRASNNKSIYIFNKSISNFSFLIYIFYCVVFQIIINKILMKQTETIFY